MKKLSALLLLFALAAPTPAQTKAEQELIALEHQIGAAVMKQDTAFLERVWADDFTYGGVRGELRTKAEVLGDIKAGGLKFELLKFDDHRVRIYGATAVVNGRATTKGQGPLGEISGQYRYTRVYVKRAGQWRLVAFQGTPIV